MNFIKMRDEILNTVDRYIQRYRYISFAWEYFGKLLYFEIKELSGLGLYYFSAVWESIEHFVLEYCGLPR